MTATPNHHPSQEVLLAHAIGRSDHAARAIVEAHAHLCNVCAAELGRLASPGGRLLSDLPVGIPPQTVLDRIMDRLPGPPAEEAEEVPLPPHLLSLLPRPGARAWRKALGRGIRLLTLIQEEGVELFVLNLSPGAAFPYHAHWGRECALLLEGSAKLGSFHYKAGDWAEFAPGSAHAPKADREGCWLLVRVEGGVRLSGWRGWLRRLGMPKWADGHPAP